MVFIYVILTIRYYVYLLGLCMYHMVLPASLYAYHGFTILFSSNVECRFFLSNKLGHFLNISIPFLLYWIQLPAAPGAASHFNDFFSRKWWDFIIKLF
jgi:hypothetical protein